MEASLQPACPSTRTLRTAGKHNFLLSCSFVFLLQVFDFLKTWALKCFKDQQFIQGSRFLQDLAPLHCSISATLLEVVANRWVEAAL